MKFIDRVTLSVKAGDGGNGMVSFRREKYVPQGGPSGGDGGDGGNIIFMVDENKSTLLDLRYNKKIIAGNGGHGKTKKMHGAKGEDVVVRVPAGTIVRDLDSQAILADLTRHEQKATIAAGGKGGRGNFHFRSPRNTAPEFAEKGAMGEKRNIEVELKVLADVGLVGFPSVGKSTLLAVVSAAKPEIADYPFTTITPNLGLVQVGDGRSFVMADMPGLIEGASLGKGMGHDFLKHIERCRVLIHVVDMGAEAGRDPVEDYRIINEELNAYEYRLLQRPQIVCANKMDIEGAKDNLVRFKQAYPDVEVFETIAFMQEGIQPLLYRTMDLLAQTPLFPLYDKEGQEEDVLYKFEEEAPLFTIEQLEEGYFEIRGEQIEKAFRMANLDTVEGEQRFARKMRKMGIDQALRDAGCKDGDTVGICDIEFDFIDD